MLVFGDSGCPVILFPTSCARYYENKDYRIIESATRLIDNGKVRIYCPDSIDDRSWYNTSIHPADRVKTHLAYENVILCDVMQQAMDDTKKKKVAVAGCSFGGFHAANLAFRHPDRVSALISMSGSFDIRQLIQDYYDDDCYFNNPPDYLPNLNDTWFIARLRKMRIILGTGEWDPCLEDNTALSKILESKQIPHRLDIRAQSGHDWPWWREVFPEYVAAILK